MQSLSEITLISLKWSIFILKYIIWNGWIWHYWVIIVDHVPNSTQSTVGYKCFIISNTNICPAKTTVTLKGMHICPCCNLIRSIYSFIDPIHYTSHVICNECRSRSKIAIALTKTSQSCKEPLLSKPSNESANKKSTKGVKKSIQQLSVNVVPHSSWSAVSPQKAQKMKNVVEAKLIHHRLVRMMFPFI